ncbi:hypothetical protein C8J57DRAFT_1659885, partial [Mycena rebaudengoi]
MNTTVPFTTSDGSPGPDLPHQIGSMGVLSSQMQILSRKIETDIMQQRVVHEEALAAVSKHTTEFILGKYAHLDGLVRRYFVEANHEHQAKIAKFLESSTLKPLHEQLLKVSEDLIKEKESNEQLKSANAALEANIDQYSKTCAQLNVRIGEFQDKFPSLKRKADPTDVGGRKSMKLVKSDYA